MIQKHILYQNTKWYRISVPLLQEALITVDAAMIANIFSGQSGMRNRGLAKQPHRPSDPVLPYPGSVLMCPGQISTAVAGVRRIRSCQPPCWRMIGSFMGDALAYSFRQVFGIKIPWGHVLTKRCFRDVFTDPFFFLFVGCFDRPVLSVLCCSVCSDLFSGCGGRVVR